MTRHPEDEGFCPSCFARDVSFNVLQEFTEACPDVKMSYEDWMILATVIQDEIKKGLGVPTEEAQEGEKPTVQ